MENLNTYTIKDLENLSGIKAHTIRIWEQRYGLLCPKRTDSNIRYYDSGELKKLLSIALLNKYGFRISHIHKMSEKELTDKLLSLNNTEAQLDRFLANLIGAMIDLDLEKFESQMDAFILSKGIDKTITQIVFPFLEKIGLLWTTNHINPAQEHLVTNLIRQKLIVGIEGAFSPMDKQVKIMLLLPEGDFHELGLLYLNYLLKTRGIKTIYLGANIPLRDAAYVADRKQLDFVYIHMTAVLNNFNTQSYLKDIQKYFPVTSVILSGRLINKTDLQCNIKNISIKRTFAEVLQFVQSL